MFITDEQIRDACNTLGLSPVGRVPVRGYGIDNRGDPELMTLGVTEGSIDQLLMAVQQGVAKFKEHRAQGNT